MGEMSTKKPESCDVCELALENAELRAVLEIRQAVLKKLKNPRVRIRELELIVVRAVSLLDGCFPIVELFVPTSPAQEWWKRAWLQKARTAIQEQLTMRYPGGLQHKKE